MFRHMKSTLSYIIDTMQKQTKKNTKLPKEQTKPLWHNLLQTIMKDYKSKGNVYTYIICLPWFSFLKDYKVIIIDIVDFFHNDHILTPCYHPGKTSPNWFTKRKAKRDHTKGESDYHNSFWLCWRRSKVWVKI